MTLDQLRQRATELMTHHGLIKRGWTFHVDFRTKARRLGQCRFFKKQIGISAWYAETSPDAIVEDTLKHEIAHAIAHIEFGSVGHDAAWRAMCKRVGADPIRIKLSQQITLRGRWVANCPNCKTKYTRPQPPGAHRHYYCPHCPPGHPNTTLTFKDDKPELVRNAAQRAGSRVSDILSGHISEVQDLITRLGVAEGKDAKKIRDRLRKLGHKGGLS